MTAHSCVICATPRTGSSLLCGLLASTGVAGIPESYFRREDEGAWAQRWGLPARAGVRDFGDFVRHALAAGRTANGVFGVRTMWGTMDELVALPSASPMRKSCEPRCARSSWPSLMYGAVAPNQRLAWYASSIAWKKLSRV